MLKEYIKRTHLRLPFSYLLLLHLPFFTVNFIFFIVLPLASRRHCIIEERLASWIKVAFLFCIELLIVPTSKHIMEKLDNYNRNCTTNMKFCLPHPNKMMPTHFHSISSLLFASLVYALINIFLLVLHLFLIRFFLTSNKVFMFFPLFSFFFLLFAFFYFPAIIAKKIITNKHGIKHIIASSLKESFLMFVSHPFFTSLLFLHSLFLLFLYPTTLFFYPSITCILYNTLVAYDMLTSC